MLVREVMSNEAITVPLGTTVKSALAVLAGGRITSVPVVSAPRHRQRSRPHP
jgi:CBS domain-containing protein